ncbi:MAG: hypothetical protein ABR915_07270, partial [Thermoguttaceae bacterium]
MKATAYNKNRSVPREAPRVSLFPFLAVLICTMGALVLVLLAVTRQARRQAIQAARAQRAQQGDDVKTQRETVQWRIEALRKSRQETQSQLADARLILGHVEEHALQLRRQLSQLTEAGRQTETSETEAVRRRGIAQDELAKLETQLAA